MNELQVFKHESFGNVRVIERGGEPWFVAADVCKALEIGNPSMALERLDADEKMTLSSTESHSGQRGGAQQYSIINEPGLYSLVLGSRKPEAKEFKRWVTHEVIPAIRKHGAYATPRTVEQMIADPAAAIKILTALKDEQERRKELECKMEQDEPKVLFAKAVETSDTTILVGQLAKLIRQNGIEIGQNRLFKWLRANGYLMKHQNIPTQYSMERGLMEIKERTVNNPDGSVRITQTPMITGKGQTYFVSLFLKGA